MSDFLFYISQIPKNQIFDLSDDEAGHLRVMRPRIKQTIRLTDGQGNLLTAKITKITKRKITIEQIGIKFIEKPPKPYIHLALAPTKNLDRLEWLIEKCTEIGFNRLTFLFTQYTERKHLKTDRLRRKVISALKQSKQVWLPQVDDLTDFSEFLASTEAEQKFIAYVDTKNPTHLIQVVQPQKTYCLLIGPEGDFSPSELEEALEAGFQKVSLGKNRLRTETAGIVGCHVLNLANLM